MQVYKKIQYIKWKEQATWHAAIVIQAFWRSCLNVMDRRYSMKQIPTYLQDVDLVHRRRVFKAVRLAKPLPYFDYHNIMRTTEDILIQLDDRLELMEELLVPPGGKNDDSVIKAI